MKTKEAKRKFLQKVLNYLLVYQSRRALYTIMDGDMVPIMVKSVSDAPIPSLVVWHGDLIFSVPVEEIFNNSLEIPSYVNVQIIKYVML